MLLLSERSTPGIRRPAVPTPRAERRFCADVGVDVCAIFGLSVRQNPKRVRVDHVATHATRGQKTTLASRPPGGDISQERDQLDGVATDSHRHRVLSEAAHDADVGL